MFIQSHAAFADFVKKHKKHLPTIIYRETEPQTFDHPMGLWPQPGTVRGPLGFATCVGTYLLKGAQPNVYFHRGGNTVPVERTTGMPDQDCD
eukprot:1191928-Prorocentrum_minimum.AAC.6